MFSLEEIRRMNAEAYQKAMARAKELRANPLTREDWVEIYYAVRDKYETGSPVSSDRRWKAHMKSILKKLGPDGEKMTEEGK